MRCLIFACRNYDYFGHHFIVFLWYVSYKFKNNDNDNDNNNNNKKKIKKNYNNNNNCGGSRSPPLSFNRMFGKFVIYHNIWGALSTDRIVSLSISSFVAPIVDFIVESTAGTRKISMGAQ